MPIKVALADDHNLVRLGIKHLVNALPGFNVIMEAANGKELLDQLSQLTTQLPDLAMIDVSMPTMNGIDATKQMTLQYPDVKVVALSVSNEFKPVTDMILSGARAYLLKDATSDVMCTTLQHVHEKGYYYDKLVVESLLKLSIEDSDNDYTPAKKYSVDVLSLLTKREVEFMKLCCSEMTYKEIADVMNISLRTVDGYRDAVFSKLELKSRVGIVLFVINNGWLQPQFGK